MADRFRTQEDFYHPTVPRTLRDVDLDFSRMDDINYLRYRNVQLETELRFLREQLAQAHSGTQYVISCFTKAHEFNSTTSVNRDDPKRHRLRDADAHSSQRLGITRDDVDYAHEREELGSRRLRSNDIHNIPRRHHSGGLHSATSAAQPFHPKDLLTFENDNSSPTVTNLQSPLESFQSDAHAGPASVGNSLNTSFTSVTSIGSEVPRYITDSNVKPLGLGIYNSKSHHQSEVHPPWDLHREPNYILENRKAQSKDDRVGTALPYDTDAAVVSAPTKQWCAIRSRPPSESEVVFDRMFFDEEHNRLMNSACFIEEMSGEEREQHWVKLGREKGRHSAKEWKLYYEKLIRPAYIAKTHKNEVIPSTTSANAIFDGTVMGKEDNTEKLAELHAKSVDADSSKLKMLETSPYDPSHEKDNSDVVPRDFSMANQIVETPVVPEHAGLEPLLDSIHKSPSHEVYQSSYLTNKESRGSRNVLEDQLLPVVTPQKVGGDTDIGTTSSPAFSDLKTTIYTPNTNSTSNVASPPTFSQATTPLRRRSPFSSFPTETSQIFYSPDLQDSSHFRTTVISNIGSGITLAEVISNIHGGRIVRARFFETSGMKTVPAMSTNTVMIEFLSADDATAAFDIRTQEVQNSQDASQLFDVAVLRTPTRPLHPKLEFDMRSRGLTRVFYIVSEKQKWTPEAAMQEIMHGEGRQKRPLVAGELGEGMLFFEFADVRDAAMAWEVVDRDQWCFRGVKKGFLPDPCSGRDDQVEGEKEGTSGSDADDEGDGGSTAVNTPGASFEAEAADGMGESDGVL